jgi:hypothetical protein
VNTLALSSDRIQIPGVLLLYEDPLVRDATTVREHVEAFGHHSQFTWYPFNVHFGLPPALDCYQFSAVVFHYSLRPTYLWLNDAFRRFLPACAPYKVAIFQDEIWYFAERERFLTEFRIDCLYSRHKPQHVRDVYNSSLPVKKFVHYLAGYVSDDLIARASRQCKPFADRSIDVGYRGRRLPYYFGRGGQEKGEIAERFAELTAGRDLKLDLASAESDRLYGDDWDRFLADCRAMLGVEGGVSIVDRSGRYRAEYERMVRDNPALTYAEYEAAMGPDFRALEDRIDYRSLTPRHLESAAFRNLQILYEGKYDGILQPWTHYVPLRKDFSNLDEVLAVLADPVRATAITDRAYADLIASGRYSYAGFVRSFDEELIAAGIPSQTRPARDLDEKLRGYLTGWARFQSRVIAFNRMTHQLITNDPNRERGVLAARDLLADYRREVDVRSPEAWSPRADWFQQARDRYFWRQVERVAGAPVPQYDQPSRRLSPAEWLVAAPGGFMRAARHGWTKLVRKARSAMRRVFGRRGRVL